MADLSFRNATTLVFDPVAANRNSTRGVLYSIGFRDIETTADIDSLSREAGARFLDLIVIEATGSVETVARLIERVRHGEIGPNPFAVIVVTAWDLSQALVRAVVQSGADDLIARPFSVAQMQRRLQGLIEGRKKFVVTSDYIGPDRRRDPARLPGIELIDVPNTLKARVADNLPADKIQAMVADMRENVGTERMRRLAHRIAITARLLNDRVGDSEIVFIDPTEIADLRRVCLELSTRASEGNYASITELCMAALKVCERLVEGARGKDANLGMLANVAAAIQVALNPARNEAEMAIEIADTVRSLKARATHAH